MTAFLFHNGTSKVLTHCDDCAVRWSSSLEADGPTFVPCPQCDPLGFLRRVMNYIHASKNIFYNVHSKAVYSTVARVASDLRATLTSRQ